MASNGSSSPDNSDLPQPRDDSGINNNHVLDLCDYVITTTWKKYIESPPNKLPSTEELNSLAQTLTGVWILAQEIIDLDRRLRMQAEFQELGGDDDGPLFEEDSENPEEE